MEGHAGDNTPPLFLGVDGGGSKSLAVIVDAGGVQRGRGHAGSSNFRAVGIERAIAHLSEAITVAAAGVPSPLPLAAAWFGLAGLHTPRDADLVLPHLRRFAHEVHASNDVELVLGGLEIGIGIALVAGTGSVALGRDAAGRRAQVGGWGHALGDEGSGYDIGRRGLQAAVRAADGRDPPTLLLELVVRHWALATPRELVACVYQDQERARVAGLAPVVLRAARLGDAAARRIRRYATTELTHLATTVIDALELGEQPVPLALGGGLLIHQPDLRRAVVARIRRQRRLGHVTVVHEPALSAALSLTAQHAGCQSGAAGAIAGAEP
jgi:N-acetylglucosamine kinase-like BadF-type ATPase